jgi:metallophosphoesterase (TIGR00282 family)
VNIRILYISEIVGKGGIFTVKKLLPELRSRFSPDVVIANADGATGGAGVGKAHAMYLRKLGLDVVTTGEAAFYKKDILELFPKSGWLLRPENYPPEVPGKGIRLLDIKGCRVAVMQLLGQSGFTRVHLDNPFRLFDEVYPHLRKDADLIVVDFHAATSAEKNAFFRHVDGRAALVVGSHMRTLTADAGILPGGTAKITDAGRTGSMLSIGGLDTAVRLQEYLSGIPAWAKDTGGMLEIQGVFAEVQADGKAVAIESFRIPCQESFND